MQRRQGQRTGSEDQIPEKSIIKKGRFKAAFSVSGLDVLNACSAEGQVTAQIRLHVAVIAAFGSGEISGNCGNK